MKFEKNKEKRMTIAWTVLSLIGCLSIALSSKADEPANCYKLTIPDTAEMGPNPTKKVETWCYQHLSDPAGSTYIYNADEEEVKPELAMIINNQGVLTHGSLRSGEVSVHRVRSSQFNPYSIPIEEPRNLEPVRDLDLNRLASSAQRTLQALLEDSSRVEDLAITPGHSESYVPATALPWRGYWWPYRGQPMFNGPDSPLGRLDRFVEAKTGTNPGAVDWEAHHHNDPSVSWYGHCNGWAAAAILRAEPKFTKRDASTNVSFSVISQKGLLSEKDYCASISFFGHRNNGGAFDDPEDIYPKDFHRVITYYLGSLKKAIAVDYKAAPPVDTHIASGYSMDIQKTGSNSYTVTTRLRMHEYDGYRTNTPGVAPMYTRVYRYTLTTDSSGNITGGKWLSSNPDFLWVPLSPARCSSGNPRVTESWIQTILNLPQG